MKKVYIKTWGCQMNEYDSSIIINILKNKNQYIKTIDEKKADILILNTCSIREKAQEKVFDQLGRWKILKNKNKKILIAVGGCVASQEGLKIKKRANYVDIIFGPRNIHKLPFMIKNFYKNQKSSINIKFDSINSKYKKKIYNLNVKSVTGLISIMEGCNNYCTFCIVPYTRGREESRPMNSIISEINQMSKKGVKEINLLGQNVNSYKSKTINGKIYSFADLLTAISNIDGIEKIRFTTSNPMDFNEDIIDVYKNISKISSFLHLPIQSGSNKILNLMKRRYDIKKYKKIVNKLSIARKNIRIGSDFIVGFPGETKKDFEKTIKLVQEINFDTSFSFIYSPRPGTPSLRLKDNVSVQEKKNRLYKLQNILQKQLIKWNKSMIGTIQRVLVHGFSRKDKQQLSGKTDNNKVVNFYGNSKIIGRFVNIKITGVHVNSLKGILI
ncbi:tRNA (N6-isopentenyl adenosine(37)-C2)-methylthiotransferase MiaB [Buchnera aphidicola (Taiwanaphis decaspermi)]|uniref:tRNA (N6-isopentenyl adenosine(37)-C2)-methylthiotransferase MiaB n=1 Tax=Buchnera aphidicola TaxID=9 RepID=UPI0031B82174